MHGQVAALMFLSLVANAQQRSLSSITCDAPCNADEFKAEPLVVLCGGGTCISEVNLGKGKTEKVISLPVGTQGVQLRMEANDDMDLNLYDATDNTCIAGAQCQDGSAQALTGCSSVNDYCLSYQGMSWYFTGDDQENPVVEALKLSPEGNVTVALDVTLQAASRGTAQVFATNAPFENCPEQLPGCRKCSEHTGCSTIETPMCDGSATVVCAAPTTTSLTGTSITATSTSLTTTSVTSTSVSATKTTTATKTSTSRTSTITKSSVTFSSTVTSLTRSITSSISTTRSSTSITASTTSLTSLTLTSSSTKQSATRSTTTSLTGTSITRTLTTTTTLSLTRSSSTSVTHSSTRSTTTTRSISTTSVSSTSISTTSITGTSITRTTSTSLSTSETTVTQSLTTSMTSTGTTSKTSSTSRSSTVTSITGTSTESGTTVTVTSSMTTTMTKSSTWTSVTISSTITGTTSITRTTSSTSLSRTSTTTTLTATTTTRTDTSSSSSITSSSMTTSSTQTCGCCNSCWSWASMMGCGSIALCQRQLKECQETSLACQDDLRAYQTGLEECRSREDFLSEQLSSKNCTNTTVVVPGASAPGTVETVVLDSDDNTAALWLLVVLVLLLLVALILLLILCWRLRNRYQATKEQLAHCLEYQDQLTKPLNQEEAPELHRKIRKLQRELDDAKQQLAAKATLELKLKDVQQRLGQDQENVRRGQELWKLNRSMYAILRQVVQDSREFAQGVREASEKAPAVKQRIEQFESKLAISSGRRDAAEAELAMLKNQVPPIQTQPSEVDTTYDSESPISISTGLGRRAKSKESQPSRVASPPPHPGAAPAEAAGEVPPIESPRCVVPVVVKAPDPPSTGTEAESFTSVAPTNPAPAFAPKDRVLKRGLTRQESKIEQVLAQRLDVTPASLRENLRQVGQKARDRTPVLERVLSKRSDEAFQPADEIPMEPTTSQAPS